MESTESKNALPNKITESIAAATNNNSFYGVTVREMEERDAPVVAKLWRNGLQQTVEACPSWWLRQSLAVFMAFYGHKAMQKDGGGDIGPEGMYLMAHWNDKNKKESKKSSLRRMFVAELIKNNDGEESENRERCCVVVGCIGVKKGFEFDKDEPESSLASIWRMSVESSVRRQGVGLALMKKAEDWARSNQCTSMKLVTANAIAAKFYIKKAGYQMEQSEQQEQYWWERMKPQNLANFYTKEL